MISNCEFGPSLGSASGQKQVVSTETVVSETVVDAEEDDEEKRLRLFQNRKCVDIFYALLDYSQLSGNDDIVNGSIMKPARPNGCVVTVLTCLKQKIKRGGHRQKVFVNTFTGHMSETANQLIEQARRFLQI